MNREKIISNYEGFDEFISPSMSVIEVGCGTGYYGFYLADKCRAYHGVDLTPKHIAQFEAGITERGLKHMSASVGDATKLKEDGWQYKMLRNNLAALHWAAELLEAKKLEEPR